MKYEEIIEAAFVERPNRFIARVCVDGEVETVHVKNTGRCKELLLPGSRVVLSKARKPERKTKWDLVAVFKEGLGWVNIDSQAPNVVVKEWLESGESCFLGITYLKPEYTFGKSRVDFYLECGDRKILMEVKGCTLEVDSVGYFPDAPSERAVKHLRELAKATTEGYECYLAFVIAMNGVKEVLPNEATHKEFAKALDEARRAGVKVLFLQCGVKPDELKIVRCS